MSGPRLKRVYEPAAAADGERILVERLWPRGLSKAKARVDSWPRELAPSTQLRKWFDHREERWPEFRTRYFAELDQQPEAVAELVKQVRAGPVTFVFASREEHMNNAAALKEYVKRRASRRRS